MPEFIYVKIGGRKHFNDTISNYFLHEYCTLFYKIKTSAIFYGLSYGEGGCILNSISYFFLNIINMMHGMSN